MLKIDYGKYSSYHVKGEYATKIHESWMKQIYVVISLKTGFVLICATICCIKNFEEASGEF